MRVCRIVYVLQLLLLLERSGVSRGWRTQITSPSNIKGAVPKKSHEEQTNSLREISWSQVRSANLKLSLEECISVRNGRYAVCPNFESRKYFAKTKRSDSKDGVELKEATRESLGRVKGQFQSLMSDIDAVLEEELKSMEQTFKEQFRVDFVKQEEYAKRVHPQRRSKRHHLHYHSGSNEWTYEPQSYVIHGFSAPIVLIQWPNISPEYIQEFYNLFSETNRREHHKNRRKNHREHLHDHEEEHRNDEDYEDHSDEIDNKEISTTMSPLDMPLTKPTNAPLSHMLLHIYPPWPVNKTANKNIKK